MKTGAREYPLEALRRVRREGADRATGHVAVRIGEWSAAEEARVAEELRLAGVERRIAEQDLPAPVLETRALAAAGAHRTRLRAERNAAREALAAAAGRVEVARGLLEEARQAQRSALVQREAIEQHHDGWRAARLKARLLAEDDRIEEVVAARWGRG